MVLLGDGGRGFLTLKVPGMGLGSPELPLPYGVQLFMVPCNV